MSRPRTWTDPELRAYGKATLEVIVDARGITVDGSGRGGMVVVNDLVASILEHQDATGLNPAREADPPPPPEPKRYAIVGTLPVFERAPGSEFDAILDPVQERMLIDGGALRIVTAPLPDDSTADDLTDLTDPPDLSPDAGTTEPEGTL